MNMDLEFAAKLEELSEPGLGDAEALHSAADTMLLMALRAAGFVETAKAFEELRKAVGFLVCVTCGS